MTAPAPAATKPLAGPLLFVRYAYPPNVLGYFDAILHHSLDR